MALSMQNAYAARLVEAARAMEAGTPAREIYEQLRHQLDAYEKYGDYPDHTLHEELAKRFAQEYKRKSARGEYDLLQKRRAEEARQVAELRMPHNVCTVSAAVDLWIVKFGDGWVRKSDIAEIVDPGNMNWTRLARRLYEARRMEDQNEHWRVIT